MLAWEQQLIGLLGPNSEKALRVHGAAFVLKLCDHVRETDYNATTQHLHKMASTCFCTKTSINQEAVYAFGGKAVLWGQRMSSGPSTCTIEAGVLRTHPGRARATLFLERHSERARLKRGLPTRENARVEPFARRVTRDPPPCHQTPSSEAPFGRLPASPTSSKAFQAETAPRH